MLDINRGSQLYQKRESLSEVLRSAFPILNPRMCSELEAVQTGVGIIEYAVD